MTKPNRACIVIPIYRAYFDEKELVSLKQCFKVLGNHQIYFVIPKKLEAFIRQSPYITNGMAAFKTFDDSFFKNIPAYNRLLINILFSIKVFSTMILCLFIN